MKYKILIFSSILFLVSGCSSIAKGVANGGDDAMKAVIKNVDPPPIIHPPINTGATSSAISNFIKQAGKSKGISYIQKQVNNRKPVSQQSLAQVIFSETVSEMQKTGQKFLEREVRQLAYNEAIQLINEYNAENNNQAKVKP